MDVDFLAVLVGLGRSGGLLAVVALLYGVLYQRLAERPRFRQVFIGLLFGAATALSMSDPVTVAPGIVADGRSLLVTLAAPFGGLIASAITVVIAAACRMEIGGVGAVAGVAGIVIAAAVGVAFTRVARRAGFRWQIGEFLLLGAVSLANMLSILLLPLDVALPALKTAALPLAAVNLIGICALGTMLARERRRIEAEAELRRMATTDLLTGLANRRAFLDALERRCAEARRHGRPFSVLLVDADRFKRVNDTHGHDVGDRVLVALGQALRGGVRCEDVVARYGGEEFTVLLADADRNGAMVLGERLCARVRSLNLPTRTGKLQLTVSIGVATFLPGRDDPLELMKAADEALYRAKTYGRNRVEAAHHPCRPHAVAEAAA